MANSDTIAPVSFNKTSVYLHAGFRQRLLDHMSLSCGEFEQSVLIITFKVQIVWISFSNGIRMLVHHPYNT